MVEPDEVGDLIDPFRGLYDLLRLAVRHGIGVTGPALGYSWECSLFRRYGTGMAGRTRQLQGRMPLVVETIRRERDG